MKDLWVSQKTGRRRRGTSISELRQLFEIGITARAIEEPLKACLPYENSLEVARKMRDLEFDVLGVKSPCGDHVEGYVDVSDLNSGYCEDHKSSFQIEDLISDSTPLIQVLPILRERVRVFVISGNQVDGIVTRADLQKPPIRLLLFGLITLLEMHLTYLIRHHFPGNKWETYLTSSRIDKAQETMRMRASRNEEIDLVDCLQFCDKRDIILGSESTILGLGFTSKKSGMSLLRNIEKLRDKLAHSQDIIAGTSWEEVISVVARVEELVKRSEKAIVSGRLGVLRRAS